MDSPSIINTSHNQINSANNKEETKMKSMLQGSYDFIHRETGKMIHKKTYKKAYQLLDRFYSSRKDLQLAEMVQLNRRIVNCVNKIIKSILLKPDIEQDRPEVMAAIYKRGQQAIFEFYKYLNLYIQKVIPNEAKGIVLEEVSHLSSSSDEEEEERIQEPEVTVLIYKINEYKTQKRHKKKQIDQKQQQEKQQFNPYEQEVSESSRISEMIQKNVKPLNIQFELDQYWYCLLELLLNGALIHKKNQKFKIAYYYLFEADRVGGQIIHTPNPNLVNVCARVKLQLANFLYECGEIAESVTISGEALVILQGEMRIRLNQEKYVLKKYQKRETKRIKRCVCTFLSTMVTMMCNYEEQNNYHKMMETLNTASWVGEKYIQGIQEFKKHVIKLAQEGRHRLEPFLKDLAELSYVAENTLDEELHKIRRIQREKVIESQSEHLKKFNEDMYNLFQLKPLNQQLYLKQNIKQPIQSNQDYKLESEHQKQIIDKDQPYGTDASYDHLFDSDSDKDSFFDGSFFAPSIDNIDIDSKMFEDKKQSPQKKRGIREQRKLVKSASAQQSKQKGKTVGLIKIGLERPADYKSKILTTTQYFQDFKTTQEMQQGNKQDDLLKSRLQMKRRELSNLQYRQHPDRDEDHKQDLDVYVNRLVTQKIEDGQIEKYDKILQDLKVVQKKEEFDKKEFSFGKKMLNLKSKEELKPINHYNKVLPVKIEVDTKVKNHAFVVDGKFNSETHLKELKRRKIDIMVAGKKIVQNQVNLSLKDPEETKYLKKVLENSKKKKLKDLIYKYREQLQLTKYFANLQREQKEQERILKLRQAIEKEMTPSPDFVKEQPKQVKEAPKAIESVKISQTSPVQSSNKLVTKVKRSTSPLPRKPILKRAQVAESISVSPSQSQKNIEGTDFLLFQEQMAKAKKQQKEMIDKSQKKSHQVIGMIIDNVERKMDTETKDLKKLLFKQKGGSKEYIDDDERTYLRFMPKYTDLSRSTYLMYIKRELAEKQTFTFEDIAMLRYQMNKRSNIADIANQAKENNN